MSRLVVGALHWSQNRLTQRCNQAATGSHFSASGLTLGTCARVRPVSLEISWLDPRCKYCPALSVRSGVSPEPIYKLRGSTCDRTLFRRNRDSLVRRYMFNRRSHNDVFHANMFNALRHQRYPSPARTSGSAVYSVVIRNHWRSQPRLLPD